MRPPINWLLIGVYVTWQLAITVTSLEHKESLTNTGATNQNDTIESQLTHQNSTLDQDALDDELEDEIAAATYQANEQQHSNNGGHKLKLDSHTISRLRNMIHESHKQATDHAREMGMLKGLKSIKEHFKEEKKRIKGKDKGKGGGGGYDYPHYPVGQPYPPPPGWPPNYYAPPGPYGYDEHNYFGRGPADSYANEDKKKGMLGFGMGGLGKKNKNGLGGQNMFMSNQYPPQEPPLPDNYPDNHPVQPMYTYSRIPYPPPEPPSSSSSYNSYYQAPPQSGSPSPPPSKTNYDQQQQQEQQPVQTQPIGTKRASAQENIVTDNKGGKGETSHSESQIPEGMPARELLHSDARQASIFSGLHMPGSNPFQLGQQSLFQPNYLGTNNLFQSPKLPNLAPFPTLPSLPTLPTISMTLKPGPKPKTSVIGNEGGPMSLTNDNVVVVNVLSNNW